MTDCNVYPSLTLSEREDNNQNKCVELLIAAFHMKLRQQTIFFEMALKIY